MGACAYTYVTVRRIGIRLATILLFIIIAFENEVVKAASLPGLDKCSNAEYTS